MFAVRSLSSVPASWRRSRLERCRDPCLRGEVSVSGERLPHIVNSQIATDEGADVGAVQPFRWEEPEDLGFAGSLVLIPIPKDFERWLDC